MNTNEIAIVGVSCKFPGADNYNQFWNNLEQGINSITEIPQERWQLAEFYSSEPHQPNKSISKWGGFIKDIDKFDAHFFGISPREAIRMDPQQRLMLELSWSCLEDAGYSPSELSGSPVGVFIGTSNYDYDKLQLKYEDKIERHTATGTFTCIIPNRISYLFNFSGPSVPVDTACSSSLVAIHQAVNAIKEKECELALVGGINVLCSPETYISFSQMGMLSPNGQCKTFDSKADGFVRGEGAGVVLLKPLKKAIEDGDNIYGVIKGSAVNHGGKAQTLTSPDDYAHAKVICAAFKKANIAPDTVSYIETHGTATRKGDPIEINGLKRAFKQLYEDRSEKEYKRSYCGLSSVKTNIGHLEPSAGIAGLIKVILAMKHGKLPKTVNFQQLNPRINLDESPFYVIRETQEWNRLTTEDGKTIPLRAGVNSFGFGGVNAHVVLEEAPHIFQTQKSSAKNQSILERPLHLLTLSGKTEEALDDLVERYYDRLETSSKSELADFCYTANTGRTHFNYRLAILSSNQQGLKEKLLQKKAGEEVAGLFSCQLSSDYSIPKLVFLFTGQGSQYLNMGRRLYQTQPSFRQAIDRCNEILHDELEHPLLEVLYPQTKDRLSLSLLDQTAYTQPALFAIEYALFKLWQSWGIQPNVVMGHSVGEYVAATVAGVFSLEDGLKLIANRGRLMQQLPSGGEMIAVATSESKMRSLITPYEKQVSIAAINGPLSVVISGATEAIEAICKQLESEEIKIARLQVSHAFHSPLMESVLAEFEAVANQVTYNQPQISLISNLTGSEADEKIATPQYWVNHIRQPVRFAQGMETLHKQGDKIFLEIGPKPTLLGMGRQCLPALTGVWLPSMSPKVDEWQQLLSSLGQLYVQGVEVDWSGFDRDYPRQKVTLPTYPFQRQRYWIDTDKHDNYEKRYLREKASLHPLLGQQLSLAGLDKQYYFESYITEDRPSYLADHRVFEKALFPTTAYLEMALTAGLNLFSTEFLTVENFVIGRGLILPSEETKTVQTRLISSENQTSQFQIFTKQQQDKKNESLWMLHAQGTIRSSETDTTVSFDLEKCKAECNQYVEVKQHYQQYHNQGIDYGTNFQRIQEVWKGSNQALAKIHLSSELAEQSTNYQFHPALLDAALQVITHVLPKTVNNETYLPIGIDRFRTFGRPNLTLWVIASIAELKVESRETFITQITIVSDEGKIVATIEGLRVKRATPQALLDSERDSITNWLYEVEWRPKARFGRLLPPECLLTPSEIKQELNPSVAELMTQVDLDKSKKVLTQLEESSVGYVVQALLEIGWTYKPGEFFTKDSAAQRLEIVPSQRRLFGRMLQILAEVSIVQDNQQQLQMLRTLEEVDLESKSQALLEKYPDARAELNLLHHCASQLSGVLQGKIDPVQLVFPEGDLTITTQLYEKSPTAKVMNTLVEKAITKAIEKFPKQRGIRLLEIGSGTGGTTSYILPHLNPSQTEYVFTDIGALFTTKAKEKFQDYPFVRYQTLDIETDPDLQGFDPYQYDVIIAANVLHATISMARTMTHVQKLLAPEGILVLLEGINRQRWLDLVFGMLEGWWKFDDLELRPDHPLLSTEKWKQLLSQTGFAQVEFLPESGGKLTSLSEQVVIVAKADKKKQISSESKRWLILSDREGIAQKLAEQLQSTGDVCTLVFTGEKYQQVAPEIFTIDPHNPEEFQRLITQVAATFPNLHGVVQCWTVEAGISYEISFEELESLSKLGCGTTLSLVQALIKGELSQTPRLWLVTQGAQSVPESHSVIPGVAQSSIWGMGKVIALEHPEFNCVRIDLDSNLNVEQKGLALWSEVRSDDIEDQVALRKDARYVARLVSGRYGQKPVNQQQETSSQPFRLTISEKGILENLALKPTTRRVPNPTEVEIQVKATGLNFRDVLAALGLISQEVNGVSQKHLQEINSFGRECAGKIVAVGEKVKGFEIGDSVIAFADGSFSQYVVVDANCVDFKPENLSFEEAATIPVNFLTAYYVLHYVAKISAGDRVLIHAAAGGTGMAAVQIAHQAGAEVLATASPQKWEALRGLGVKHIMNSRTTEFADQVMEITQGKGVNVVLNSLTSGEFIAKSLSVVSSQGSFIEIGKRGVWDSAKIAEVRPNISYFVVDLIQESERQPDLIKSILQELRDQFSKSLLQPPPLKLFSMNEVISAFRYMQQAKHVGKIVVTQTTPQLDAETQMPQCFREDRAYLITGGMGGLGLLIARWMIEKGAKHLILVGRRPPDANALSKLAEFKQAGAEVVVEEADVSNFESIREVLSKINQLTPPLAGVFHSAGMLSDGVLQNQSWSSFKKVMSPKIGGAWHLHQLTQNQPLDFFVLFSSIASLLGSPGQGNHSAANAFLDGLAHYRRAMGLPGLSIQWGAVSQVGEAAERGADIRMQQKGMGAISPAQVIEALELLMSGSSVEVGVVPIVWQAWQERIARWPFLADWKETNAFTKLSTTTNSKRLLEQLKITSDSERENMLSTHLRGEVARILGMVDSQIDMHQPLTMMGLDSLVAIELENRIKTEFEVNIPMSRLIEGINITALSTEISQQLFQSDKTQSDEPFPTIVPAPDKRFQPFPLNEIQQAYWLGRNSIFDLGNIATHLYMEIDCENLNLKRLNQAWQKLIEHHEMLRMVVIGDQQQILEKVPLYEIKVADLDQQLQPSQTTISEQEVIREQMSHEVLSADQWPLFNIQATCLYEEHLRLHISLDLLIADAWSIYIIFSQWMQLYQNPDSLLPALELSFRDYVLAELASKNSQQYRRCQKYWFERLDSLPPAPEIPLTKPISAVTHPRFKRRSAQLSKAHWQQLKQKAREANLTPSGVLLAAFADILNCWAKNPKFTINLTLFNRLPLHPQVNQLVGDFTSLILLEVDNSIADPFINRAQRLQKQLGQDLDHNYVSAVEVQRELRRRGHSQPMGVVFTSTLGLSSLANEEVNEGFGLEQLGEVVYSVAQTSQVWLDHQVMEEKGALVLNWDAIEELFPEGLLDQMFEAYCYWLRQLATSELSWTEIHSQKLPLTQLALQTKVNQTSTVVSEETLHSLFIKQVKVQSESTAIITSEQILTYSELYTRANQLGHGLRKLGVKPNQLVAVVMEKGWEQVVAVLGILMSGGAYVPIDPKLPQERQWYLFEQGEVQHILTQNHLKQTLSWPEKVSCWSVDTQELAELDGSPLESVQTSEDLAYVIYTSGSTGLPKGVVIDHRGAVNTILDINQRFDVKPSDKVLALSALNFDLSVYDIFGILAVGGTIVIPSPTGIKDPAHWIELIETNQVTLWNSVPALMQMLVEYLSGKSEQPNDCLRLALLSGDWLPTKLPEKIQSLWSNARVVSLGGATEASIWSIHYPIEKIDPNWKSIPYGKPLLNQRFYVLNELMESRPVFVPGQLYIGGVGLALGYWKNEQKTQASFTTHPVTQERLYKTGDLGRYLPDGNIEFIGREDFQVKINGYRVELGEIEAVVQQVPAIKEVVVAAIGDSQEGKRLVAYIVLDQPDKRDRSLSSTEQTEDNKLDISAQNSNSISKRLNKYLKQKLPDYMIPSDYIMMETLPLTANGKVNRQQLPKPGKDTQSEIKYVVPQNETEQKIAAIWQDVLQIEKVGIYDNFFKIGGNSILLIKVHVKLEEAFKIELNVVNLFTYPTINSLSQYISGTDSTKNSSEIGMIRGDNRLKKRSFRNKRANIRKQDRNQE